MVKLRSRLQVGHYRQIFAGRSFRLFWAGFTLSAVGDAMARVALTWYVYETTQSAQALGFLTLAYTGPILVGGLLAATLLDRFDRRKLMLADNAIRGTIMIAIPLLHALGRLELWQIYAAATVYGLLVMISLAGSPALVPSLVRREQLDTANALETLSYTFSGILGPPLAGLLIGLIGAPRVVLVDALSYFAFALALSQVRGGGVEEQRSRLVPSEAEGGAGERGGAREEEQGSRGAGERRGGKGLGEGVALLRRDRVLLSTTLMYMTFNVGLGFLSVWLPIYADRMAGGGPQRYGLLLGVWAAGEIISALLTGSVRMGLALGKRIALAQALSGLALALLLLGARPIWMGLGLFLLGFFSAPLTIWAQTLRMRLIPEALRGRTFALIRTLIQSTAPLGGAAAGFLLPLLGMMGMIGLSAAFIGVPGLLGLRVEALRRAGDDAGTNRLE